MAAPDVVSSRIAGGADMNDKDYRILFGGKEIPTFEAWPKLEVANAALGVLERFNRRRPQLATALTRDLEEEVRRHLRHLEILLPTPPKKGADVVEIARALLQRHTPEEAVERLRSEHGLDCDLNGLVHLAGIDAYLSCLVDEARVLLRNAISPEQIAELWNEGGRPAPGQPFWNPTLIEGILKQA